MALSGVADAFGAEASALSAVASGLTDAELSWPSPCPPWTVAGLLGHVTIASGRIAEAIDAAGSDPRGITVDALGYYRPDDRFSPAVNADRVDVAAALAARLGTAAAISAELSRVCADSLELLRAAPAHELVRTRHGDLMLVSEFAITRVLELGVHGLDLAAGLRRPPWLTDTAAAVLEDLLLPGGDGPKRAGELRAAMGCDRAGLIARLTGRTALTEAEAAVLASHGTTALVLG